VLRAVTEAFVGAVERAMVEESSRRSGAVRATLGL